MGLSRGIPDEGAVTGGVDDVVGGALEDELLVGELAARSSQIADCIMAFKLSSVSVIVFGPPPEESDGVTVDVLDDGPDEDILC